MIHMPIRVRVLYCVHFLPVFFVFSFSGHHRDLHSFPTRRSSDLCVTVFSFSKNHFSRTRRRLRSGSAGMPRSEERFSRNAETDVVCRLLLEKKKIHRQKLISLFTLCHKKHKNIVR